MDEITIRRGTPADVPRVMEIMRLAHDALEDPTAYITDSEDYVNDHVACEGFLLLAELDGKPVGFLMVELPEHGRENLGAYMDFTTEQRLKTAVMDSAAVDPAARGRGIMKQLLCRAMEETKDYVYLLATVAAHNLPSRRTMESCGFFPLREITKPGGQRRLLMGWTRSTPFRQSAEGTSQKR